MLHILQDSTTIGSTWMMSQLSLKIPYAGQSLSSLQLLALCFKACTFFWSWLLAGFNYCPGKLSYYSGHVNIFSSSLISNVEPYSKCFKTQGIIHRHITQEQGYCAPLGSSILQEGRSRLIPQEWGMASTQTMRAMVPMPILALVPMSQLKSLHCLQSPYFTMTLYGCQLLISTLPRLLESNPIMHFVKFWSSGYGYDLLKCANLCCPAYQLACSYLLWKSLKIFNGFPSHLKNSGRYQLLFLFWLWWTSFCHKQFCNLYHLQWLDAICWWSLSWKVISWDYPRFSFHWLRRNHFSHYNHRHRR
jgi:hypothetical protein